MNTLGNSKKIKGCTHKDTYNSAANYLGNQYWYQNNAQPLHFYQICPFNNFSNILTHKY